MERVAANPERIWCMSEVDIFADLNDAEMEALAAAAPMKTYPSGSLACSTPRTSPSKPCSSSNAAGSATSGSPDGRALTTAIITPGAIFGEMVVVGQQMHDSFAEALDEVVVCMMSRTDVQKLLLGDPRIAARISETLGRRLAQLEHGSKAPSSRASPNASPAPSP